MAFTRLNFRCTYAEEERWKAEARKTGRSLSAWLRWLANTASESPPLERVALAGDAVGGLPPMPGVSGPNPGAPLPSLRRPNVEVDRDWDTGLPLVSLDGELIDPWEGEKTLLELRQAGHVSATISDIRAKLKGLN